MIHKKEAPKSKIQIDLNGPEGNAFALIGMAQNFCRQLKKADPEKYNIEVIQTKMMSSDYKNLVEVFEEYFGDYVDIYNVNF